MYAAPVPVLEYIAPTPAVDPAHVPVGEYIWPEPAVRAASGPVLEYILLAPAGDVAPAPVAEYITPAPMEFVEAALHEIDEELCHDEIEELCYVVRMSQKRIWRRVWHCCSSPSDASKSERKWRALSARLCYEQGFDEMKRACACCGMLGDEDDILVSCQGLDSSLHSADHELPGVFHGRCAADLGHSVGARWQNCPWCPPTAFRAKPATVISVTEDVVGCDEERWTRKRTGIRAAWEKKLEGKLREARRRLVAALPVGASAKEKTETLREMQSTLKAEEKELRKLQIAEHSVTTASVPRERVRMRLNLLQRPSRYDKGWRSQKVPRYIRLSTDFWNLCLQLWCRVDSCSFACC